MDPNNTATNNPNTNPPANEHVHITPPTINSNTSTSPSSESTPTSQSAVAATPQSAAHPRSIFMPLIIAIIVLLLIGVGSLGGAVYVRNQAKQELRGLVDNQLTSISAIEKDYKDTEELLKLIDKRQDPEYEEETTSKQLLKAQAPAQAQFGKPAVLGVEEELNIDIERKWLKNLEK